MVIARITRISRTITLLITIFSLSLPAYAKYSGGTGEPNDPYQIATAEDLILLGESPEDYDKHFIMTADIDLDPNLPGRKVFDRAVIAPDSNDTTHLYQGIPFTGVFDGGGKKISNLIIAGDEYLSLFGQLDSEAIVSNLTLEVSDVNGTGNYVGGLVGFNNGGNVTSCNSSGTANGDQYTGGLVGRNNGDLTDCFNTGFVSGTSYIGGLVGYNHGSITSSYNAGMVSGYERIGGLVGSNRGILNDCYNTGQINGNEGVGGLVGSSYNRITNCYNTSTVSGQYVIGGLAGLNGWWDAGKGDGEPLTQITKCYSTGIVTGNKYIGGLAGKNYGNISDCYSLTTVSGEWATGGLVGKNGYEEEQFYTGFGPPFSTHGIISSSYFAGVFVETLSAGGLAGYNEAGSIINSFWDIQFCGQTTSNDGTGLTTVEMQTASIFLEAGWDFMDEATNGTDNVWWIDEGHDYPRLWWELSISADHPDYDEWVEVGEPICWCYSRQCHGDTDGKPQGKQQYWVSTNDLDVLIAAWNKPFAEIDGQIVNGVPLICADFDHKAQGDENYRVSTDDLDILIANWNLANAPTADCP